MRSLKRVGLAAVVGAMELGLGTSACAGGGGQDMILVVNPHHESSLRIANAYARLRHIPASNIIFDINSPANGHFGNVLQLSSAQMIDTYVDPLANIISQRGLGHADYIGVLGQATAFQTTPSISADRYASITYALSLLTPLSQDLLTPEETRRFKTSLYQPADFTANNNAIHHATVSNDFYQHLDGGGASLATQYYMAGAIGFTGYKGNTTDQVIAGLERTAANDGAKPQGTIYFEKNGAVNSTARDWQWLGTKLALDTRGVNWVDESNTPGFTPQNRADVQGAVAGSSNFATPNGSTYLPGSWADSLTSTSGDFASPWQNKIAGFIAAGAGATSGTIGEPYALSDRFPHSDIFVHTADGSTLGESFYKSVRSPDLQMFLGDLLAQPYADIPAVNLTGITEQQTVTGQVQVSAAALLINPTVATGIKQLELYIDGKPSDTPITAASGTFTIDTTQLSDGQHEIRIIALNNAPAESEGVNIRTIHVNNHNRSVSTINALTLDATQVAPVAISTNAGDGAVSRIELRQLGRVLGSVNTANGSINIDATALAYGDNPVVPVAIYTDGSEVAGVPINVHRNTAILPGQTPAAAGNRTPGALVELFEGQGATTIAASTYNGTPDQTMQAGLIKLKSGLINQWGGDATKLENVDGTPISMGIGGDDGLEMHELAIKITSKFEIDAADVGEYQFFIYKTNDSAKLLIDGEETIAFDDFSQIHTSQFANSVFLGAGEHDLTLLAANTTKPFQASDVFDIALMFRGPDGITRQADSSFLYTLAGILGDYNNSGQVEQGDLDLVLQNWGDDTAVTGIPTGWTNDNTNLGQIEQTELDRVLQNWGSTTAPDFQGSTVPEPATLALLSLGGLAMLRRRAWVTSSLTT